MSRVLCIVCMAYVHVHLLKNVEFESTWYFSNTRTLLADLFGRSSVPLLSMISGALLVGVARKRSWLQIMNGRARGLLVPMVVWNLVGVTLALLTARQVSDPWNAIFPFTGQAQYTHLTFLRDVFVVSLGTPLFVLLAKRSPALFFVGCVLLTTVTDLKPIVLRDQIFLYYVVGVYVGVYQVQLLRLRSMVTAAHIAMTTLVVSALASQYVPALGRLYYHPVFEDLVRRPVCALWFWFVAQGLARHDTVVAVVRRHLEPAIFLMFLSHATVIVVVGSVYARWLPHTGLTYFGVWLLLPPVCLLAAVIMNKVLARLPAPVSLLLTGQPPTSRPSSDTESQAGAGFPRPPARLPRPTQSRSRFPRLIAALVGPSASAHSSLSDSAIGNTAARVSSLSSPRTLPPSRR